MLGAGTAAETRFDAPCRHFGRGRRPASATGWARRPSGAVVSTRLPRLSVHACVALGLFVLSLVFYLLIPYQIEKPKLLMGRSLMAMEVTLFPSIAAIGLCATSALSFLLSLRHPEENPFAGMKLGEFGKMAGFLAILFLFATAFEPVGYVVSGVIVTGVLSRYLGNRNPIALALLALGVPVAVYLVFTRMLSTSLPEGILY